MTRFWLPLLPALVGAIVIVGPMAERAEAIPAFARKYRTSCMTCHVVFPKLNDFGRAFRRNGFKIPEDDDFFVKDQPVVLGAKAWEEVWPEALWPSDLPNLPPLSILTQFTLDIVEGAETKGNFSIPDQFALLGAGTLGDDISFFVHSGAGARYYLTFQDILDDWLGEDALNLKVGLFEPDVVGITNVRRVTITPTLLSTFNYDLDSGNGRIFSFDRQIGVELSGVIEDRWRYSLGLVQGSGDSPESNESKDFYYRIAFKIGGRAFNGSNLGEGEESLKQTDNWTDNSLTLGTFGYIGRASPDDARLPGLNRYAVEILRFGVDARVNWKDIDLVLGFLTGEDRNADNDGVDVGMSLFYAEADVMVFPWLMAYVRYEDLRYRGVGRIQLGDDEVRRAVIGATGALRANVRITAEYLIAIGGGGRDSAGAFFLSLTFAF